MTLISKITIIATILMPLFAQAADSFWQPQTEKRDPVQELIDNPYGRYYTKNDIDRVVNESYHGTIIRGQLILVDTREKDACEKIQRALANRKDLNAFSDPRDLCTPDTEFPLASVMILREGTAAEWQKNLSLNDLNGAQRNIFSSTRRYAVNPNRSRGIVYVLPSSITGWTENALLNKDAKAHFAIQRHANARILEKFGRSVMMASFFWEQSIVNKNTPNAFYDLLKSSSMGPFFAEIFKSLSGRFNSPTQRIENSSQKNRLSMIVLDPTPTVVGTVMSAFGDIRLTDSSRVRLVTRKPTGPLSPSQEAQKNRDKEAQAVEQETSGVKSSSAYQFVNSFLNLEDMYWGLELQFSF